MLVLIWIYPINIDALLRQDFNKPFEIIMVDDASTDNGKKIIEMENSPLIKLRSLNSNSGPSAARNVGLPRRSLCGF